MSTLPEPSAQNGYLLEHIKLLRHSLQRCTGRDLIDPTLQGIEAAKAIFTAPFMVVSHNTAADPIFNYANQTALALFEMTWSDFTSLPSRQSAERPNRTERARLLERVSTQGYIDDYAGIRISKTGQRFHLAHVTVWNLIDHQDCYQGQAAACNQWTYL